MKFISIAGIVILFISLSAFSQTGGTFEITQSVISNGGGTSDGGSFSLTGTTGQPLAGTNSTGGGFGVRGGFWQSFFAPTAAMVAISGQVLMANGGGISKVRVSLTGGDGITRTVLSNTFGYFRFDDVEAGQTCIISISSKRFQFGNQTQVIFVGEEVTDLIFNSLPE